MTGFITILYDEPDPTTYRGVKLDIPPEGGSWVFNTGDPTVDYLTAGAVVIRRLGHGARIVGASSIDHFVMDGGVLRDDSPTQEDIAKAKECAEKHLSAHPQ